MNYVLLMMSGKGTRTGLSVPKQFVKVNGKPLFIYTLEKFYNNEKIDEIIIITSKEYVDYVDQYIRYLKLFNKPIKVIEGGEERYLSVYNGLKFLCESNKNLDDNVLIHDAVRPNVTDIIINRNIDALKYSSAVLTAIKADESYLSKPRVDTIHSFNNEVYRAQTPQSFKLGIIKELYDSTLNLDPFPFHDDASLATYSSLRLTIVDGDESNYKITSKEDLEKFEHEAI